MAALPQPVPKINEIGYCHERKQTFIALKKPNLRLILRAGQVHYLRIDTLGGSPDVYFTSYKEAAYHEFYQPSRPEMTPPVYVLHTPANKATANKATTTVAEEIQLTDEQVALLTQFAYMQ